MVPRHQGGTAVADTPFGNNDPSGKLPMSFPVNVGQVPISYNELPTDVPMTPTTSTPRRPDSPNTPLYPFGYGLSYTTFSLSNLNLSSTAVGAWAAHGQRGCHQHRSGRRCRCRAVYLHENDTSILQPVHKLEGFKRVNLKPGQSQTVKFKLKGQNFGFYDNNGKFVVEPGPFNVWVGDTSVDGLNAQFTLE